MDEFLSSSYMLHFSPDISYLIHNMPNEELLFILAKQKFAN